MSDDALDAPMPYRYTFDTAAKDPEVRLIDVLTQALGSLSINDEQRYRAVDYITNRFGRPSKGEDNG